MAQYLSMILGILRFFAQYLVPCPRISSCATFTSAVFATRTSSGNLCFSTKGLGILPRGRRQGKMIYPDGYCPLSRLRRQLSQRASQGGTYKSPTGRTNQRLMAKGTPSLKPANLLPCKIFCFSPFKLPFAACVAAISLRETGEI